MKALMLVPDVLGTVFVNVAIGWNVEYHVDATNVPLMFEMFEHKL